MREAEAPDAEMFDRHDFLQFPGRASDIVRTSYTLVPGVVGAPVAQRPGDTCRCSPIRHMPECPWVSWCALGCARHGMPQRFVTVAEQPSIAWVHGPMVAPPPVWDDLDLYRDDDVDGRSQLVRVHGRLTVEAASWWLRELPGRVWAALRITGRFLRAFPVLADALAARWLADAAAIADHEYARGFEAGVRTERERHER